ncbi:MAG: hypothetical protein M0P95_17820 [Sulfuritalea sp.]|jgi:hypothetical protein|nr:hypothetical protein [Sulfuritalea sp.]
MKAIDKLHSIQRLTLGMVPKPLTWLEALPYRLFGKRVVAGDGAFQAITYHWRDMIYVAEVRPAPLPF